MNERRDFVQVGYEHSEDWLEVLGLVGDLLSYLSCERIASWKTTGSASS